jgi:hypothetical protein
MKDKYFSGVEVPRLIKLSGDKYAFRATEFVVKSSALTEIAAELSEKRPSWTASARAKVALFLSELRRKALHAEGSTFSVGEGMIREYMGCHFGYKAIKKLRDRGILTRVGNGVVGVRTDQYRVCDALLMSKNAEYEIQGGTVEYKHIAAILSKLSAWNCNGREEIHSRYASSLTRFRIDPIEAREVLAGHPGIEVGSPSWVSQALSLHDHNETFCASGRFVRLSIGTTGRVYHPICNLKECIRKRAIYLRRGGSEERVRSFDIRASQPTILAAILMEAAGLSEGVSGAKILGSDAALNRLSSVGAEINEFSSEGLDRSEVIRFKDIIENGDIYNYMCRRSDQISNWQPTRKNAKTSFLRDIISKKGNYRAKGVELAFLTDFPSIYDYIFQFNKGNHSRLIRTLQWAESEIVLRFMWDKLTKETKSDAFTVHDCFYVPPESVDCLINLADEASSLIGVKINLVESLDDKQEEIRRRHEVEFLKDNLLNGQEA